MHAALKARGVISNRTHPKGFPPSVPHKAPQMGGSGPLGKGLGLDNFPSGFDFGKGIGKLLSSDAAGIKMA